VLEPEEMHKLGLATPHTPHCLANGNIMISTMGDPQGNGKGGFFILEGGTFKMLPAVYKSERQYADFGYDYWYQPRHDVMISSQWGAPSAFKKGFDVADIAADCDSLQVFTGGSIYKGGPVTVIHDDELSEQPPRRVIQSKPVRGAAQMLQLSLDGKRLYATTSLYSAWDKQFYPELYENGAMMLRIDVDNKVGGLTVDEHFLVDFGEEPEGPVLAHELRFPGGDSTSDIWT
ncbi:selenium-binding protein, putative, partial [Ixodes scapularis]